MWFSVGGGVIKCVSGGGDMSNVVVQSCASFDNYYWLWHNVVIKRKNVLLVCTNSEG